MAPRRLGYDGQGLTLKPIPGNVAPEGQVVPDNKTTQTGEDDAAEGRTRDTVVRPWLTGPRCAAFYQRLPSSYLGEGAVDDGRFP